MILPGADPASRVALVVAHPVHSHAGNAADPIIDPKSIHPRVGHHDAWSYRPNHCAHEIMMHPYPDQRSGGGGGSTALKLHLVGDLVWVAAES